jgi:hypothetical protein
MGGSFNGSYGHAYGAWWERFSKTHPEWFAQQPNGGRDHSRAEGGKRSQFCVSNADLIAEIAKEKIQELRANPDKDCVSVSPNDGGGVTFCLCPKCEAMDAKEGEPVDIYGMKHVSLTDRYVKYYSAIAELVCKEFPDRYLGAYAYSAYRLPPIHAKLHPNVMIGYVGFGYLNEEGRQKARAQWLQWAKAAKTLFLRPNLLTAGQGVPTIYVHRLAEDIRFCHENGMLVTDFDCCYQHWSTDGVNYYVLARLLWNPKADVDAVLEDYCRAGFGPAAGQVREYFRAIEDMTDRLAKSNEYQDRRRTPYGLGPCYTDDLLKKCGALLDDAVRKAGDDATVRQRVEFLRVGLDYARIRRDLDLAKATVEAANPKKPAVDLKDDLQDAEARKKAEAAATPKVDAETGRQAAKRAKELQAEMDAFYQKIGFTWALNPPYLKFYGH